jgi:threonylcarbamoyladenosine tRNA methylthiotransferase MtaB
VKVYLDSIGCRLNQSEIEAYARQFRMDGHLLVATPQEADLLVVNTCAVTQAAVADSRQKIRQLNRSMLQPDENSSGAQIIVTGCWSTLNPTEAASLPGVSRVVSNQQKDSLVAEVLHKPVELFEREFLERQPIPGLRLRTRAFIKVQDGCDNRCTFCVTTIARGPGRSRPISAVLADIQAALAGGAKEIVLTGVHLGSWGMDFDQPSSLLVLLKAILEHSDTPRLRLSSLEPWDLNAAFFQLWQDRRLCRHLHLPLQSGCAATLRRMARKTSPQSFQELIRAARAMIPEVAITTDIIVGFPGESEAEFAQSLAFVERMAFAGGHVFTYSARPSTAAARMPGQVPHALRKERNAQMQAVIDETAAGYRQRFVGQKLEVLWENAATLGPQGWTLQGLTDNYLKVVSQASQKLWNQVTPVFLEGINPQGLYGRVYLL